MCAIDDLSNLEFLHRHYQNIGRKGGLSKSERKMKASKRNGKKGGRPRGSGKPQETPPQS